MSSCDLTNKKCVPCEGGVDPSTPEQVKEYMKNLSDDWQVNEDFTEIQCDYKFKDYYHTMAFVNAIAWMAHKENHHPDLEVGYGHCLVRYSTHAINGLSENDFICAAKVDEIHQM
ncbi:MAG: 4a-hydroxytetrahydrobiopterin dehydratase [Coxiellaceae bacterium]|nr:4a-hydroxytetrahydrobiopterin dehydratase [Coxiellaceae bacterium]